jgi:hypothetical protein
MLILSVECPLIYWTIQVNLLITLLGHVVSIYSVKTLRNCLCILQSSTGHLDGTPHGLFTNGEFQSPMATHCFVRRFLDDLALVAKPVLTPNPVVTRVREPRWIVPLDNLLKANVDRAVKKKYLDRSSSGSVSRPRWTIYGIIGNCLSRSSGPSHTRGACLSRSSGAHGGPLLSKISCCKWLQAGHRRYCWWNREENMLL